MSAIEITIKDPDDTGDVWLEVTRDGNKIFVILDSEAADLLEDILRARRPGTYQFEPLDLNG